MKFSNNLMSRVIEEPLNEILANCDIVVYSGVIPECLEDIINNKAIGKIVPHYDENSLSVAVSGSFVSLSGNLKTEIPNSVFYKSAFLVFSDKCNDTKLLTGQLMLEGPFLSNKNNDTPLMISIKFQV